MVIQVRLCFSLEESSDRLSFVNAGHNVPFVLHAMKFPVIQDGAATLLSRTSSPWFSQGK
jgi:hypothetical protein